MRIPVIVLVAGMLGACSNLSGGSPCPSVYDFGLPVARLATDRPWSGLALEIRLPSWFDSLNIDYRLAYEDAQKQHEYSRSRWAGAPAVLLAQRLRQQLGVVSASGSGADCLLRIELQEFSQVFDSARSSSALMLAQASVVDARRQAIAERSFTIEKPAATPDAEGGAKALADVGNGLGPQLVVWLEAWKRRRWPRVVCAEFRRPGKRGGYLSAAITGAVSGRTPRH